MSASSPSEGVTIAGVEFAMPKLIEFAEHLDRLLEEETTSTNAQISTESYLIWRRTNRLYHLHDNAAVQRALHLAGLHVELVDYQFEALRKFFLGDEAKKEG